jgi:Flp pilus assembly protein CpaB
VAVEDRWPERPDSGTMHDVFGQRTAVDAPDSPPAARVGGSRRPDVRLVVGIVLVLVSVVVGVRVFAAADHTSSVWVASRDLPVGTQIAAADLHRGKVHLYGVPRRYLDGGSAAPVGYVVTRTIGHDELVPSAALTAPAKATPFRLVTIPVAAFHLPPHLAPGQHVDVYVTPDRAGGGAGPARLVYPAALVTAVDTSGSDLGGDTADLGVVVSVPPSAAAALVSAVHAGSVDLAGLPDSTGAAR